MVTADDVRQVRIFSSLVGERRPGDVFGEVPITLRTLLPVGFRAEEASRIMRIEPSDYHAVAAVAPDVAGEIGATRGRPYRRVARTAGHRRRAATASMPTVRIDSSRLRLRVGVGHACRRHTSVRSSAADTVAERLMGLHNRYPSYFYKRGNLFNTYLGYSGDQGLPPATAKQTQTTTPKRRSQRRRKPRARTAAPPVQSHAPPSREAAQAGARLAGFAKAHLSLAETERLLHLLAADAGVALEPKEELDWRLPLDLGRFVAQRVTPEVAATYLAALERRLERGELLIQK
jgi:hypothetical protein